jgi:hypothetical protein
LLAGGLLLLWAGVPYSGVLLGALAVVAVLMGGVLLRVLGSLRALGRGSGKARAGSYTATVLQPGRYGSVRDRIDDAAMTRVSAWIGHAPVRGSTH